MPSLRIPLGVIIILALGLFLLRQSDPGVIEAYNTKNLVQLQMVTTGESSKEQETNWELNPRLSWLGQINLTLMLCPTYNTRGAFSFLC